MVQPLPGKRSIEPFCQRVYRDHRHGICGSDLAWIHGIGTATVERIHNQFTCRMAREQLSLLFP